MGPTEKLSGGGSSIFYNFKKLFLLLIYTYK